MVNFRDVGVVCLKGEIHGTCKTCLWGEWDSGLGQCLNCHCPICPKYREELLDFGAYQQLKVHRFPRPGGEL